MPDDQLTLNVDTNKSQISIDNSGRIDSTTLTGVSVQRTLSTNSRGNYHFFSSFTQNGAGTISSESRTTNFSLTDSANYVGGNSITDVKGSLSAIATGKFENVASSFSFIASNPSPTSRGANEAANKAQQKLVAARTTPDQAPDNSIVGQASSIVKDTLIPPKDVIDRAITPPSANEMSDTMSQSQAGGSLFSNLGTYVLNYFSAWGKAMSAVSLKTIKEIAKIQAKYPKEKVKSAIKEKKEMYNKMTKVQKEQFKEGLGGDLFDEEKGMSLDKAEEMVQNIANIIANPLSLLGLLFDFSSDNKDVPKKQVYDEKQYQNVAKECLDEAKEVEKTM